MTRHLPLTKGKFTIIDDEDFALVSANKWMAKPKRCVHECYYAQRTIVTDGRKSTVYLHRLLMGAKKGEVVDHINGDGLDNRRANLRITDLSGNAVNRTRGYNSKSGFRGVYAVDGKWRVILRVRGVRYEGGYFADPVRAAQHYDLLAFEHLGHGAILNFNGGYS